MTTVRTLAATALATALVGCASEERVAQMPGCHTEVIVEIGTSGLDLGGEHALRDLARETRTELTYDRWLGGRRYLLGLQTAKSSDRCDSALARLRADDRVAHAELDERRSASSGWDWSSSAR